MMKTLFGQKFVNARLRLMDDAVDQELSGGQMQRLAVARTFMRSSTMEKEVGLLLFDEPSASLDPTAEHGMINTRMVSMYPFSPESFPPPRPLLATAKVAREQDDDILDTSVRKSDKTCRSHLVRPTISLLVSLET